MYLGTEIVLPFEAEMAEAEFEVGVGAEGLSMFTTFTLVSTTRLVKTFKKTIFHSWLKVEALEKASEVTFSRSRWLDEVFKVTFLKISIFSIRVREEQKNTRPLASTALYEPC